MTPEERARDFFTLPPAARTHAALARMIRTAENEKGCSVSIPTVTMEQEFAKSERRCWNAAIEAAQKAVTEASVFPKDAGVKDIAERINILETCRKKVEGLKK